MRWIRENKAVIWFIVCLLLAGIANLLSRTGNPMIDTLLFRETGRRPGGVIRSLLGMVTLWYGLVLLNILVLDKHTNYRLFNVPEIHIFGMLGVIEICIRRRLIPYNENYAVFSASCVSPR